jgi:hypothetical protein
MRRSILDGIKFSVLPLKPQKCVPFPFPFPFTFLPLPLLPILFPLILLQLLIFTFTLPLLTLYPLLFCLSTDNDAQGIQQLHDGEPQIVHRDLKSLNLLVNDKWEVKVLYYLFSYSLISVLFPIIGFILFSLVRFLFQKYRFVILDYLDSIPAAIWKHWQRCEVLLLIVPLKCILGNNSAPRVTCIGVYSSLLFSSLLFSSLLFSLPLPYLPPPLSFQLVSLSARRVVALYSSLILFRFRSRTANDIFPVLKTSDLHSLVNRV